MKLIKVLGFAVLIASSPLAVAAAPVAPVTTGAPAAAHLKSVHDMLAAMRADMLMRSIAGASRFASEDQRKSVFAKLDKVPPAQIYQRLTAPVARLVSAETALEMTRFYSSTYGQKVLKQTYNSGPSYGSNEPAPTPAERKELKRPEYRKAHKAFLEAESAIRHEGFVLLQAISKR